MEVHHHPNLHHGKKKFKEYFLEFLMIFLAVSMGFIAENIREHKSEARNACRYLNSYKNDLLLNKRQIERYDSIFTYLVPRYDSIVTIFYEKKENEELPLLSRLLLDGARNSIITLSTPTYQQLISSGSMKCIDNKKIDDSIAYYHNSISLLYNYNDRIVSTLNNELGAVGEIEDMHDFWNPKKGIANYVPDMQPFTLTAGQRNFIISYYKVFEIQAISNIRNLKKLKYTNSSLIKMINEELH
ncbi:MAG: hypothetical protein JWN78_3043 [Bacteroidota bacterium]|nr:hypothetical protein [Bacteroidota bacterium]